MARKITNSKNSKVKSTNKINRDEILKNKQFDEKSNLDVNIEKIKENVVDVQPNINNHQQKQPINQNNQSEQVANKEINDKDILIKKLMEENNQLKEKNQNLIIENKKLFDTIEEERKQLIAKLQEKASSANLQVQEKLDRLEQEKKNEIKKIKESVYIDVISNFLDPILLFESTVEQAPTDNQIVYSYVQGYKMIISMFKDKLNNLGIEQIDVNVGDEFNESFMEAFDVEENNSFPPNKVVRIVSKGFAYMNKVIKFTSVVVSK